jgi:hypothetical protein
MPLDRTLGDRLVLGRPIGDAVVAFGGLSGLARQWADPLALLLQVQQQVFRCRRTVAGSPACGEESLDAGTGLVVENAGLFAVETAEPVKLDLHVADELLRRDTRGGRLA